MNLVAFPARKMDLSVLRRILQGGIDKMAEAGVVLIGGHSIEDEELKYGLSVTGFVHPDRVLTKKSLRTGDQVVLTKSLGTGIVNTAIKGGLAPDDLVERVCRQMAELNRTAAGVMSTFNVGACTDITGFGFLGHLAEMVEGSGMSIRVHAADVPVIKEALAYADMGLIPAGAHKNREFRDAMLVFSGTVSRPLQDVLVDPQTSGGLLISVDRAGGEDLVAALKAAGVEDAALVGEVVDGPEEKIRIE
jgi:selenide,water dikinase